MRLAILSDIHGNLTALEAVLDDLDTATVDRVVCLGDIVGYGPKPGACLSRVRDVADVVIAGNHDRDVRDPGRYAGHQTAGPGLRHSAATLDAEALDWLANLPERRSLAGGSIRLAHSHPDPSHTDQYVSPYGFEIVAQDVDADVLLLGHTHVQAAETSSNTLVVNPGSVGQPRDGNPDAAYAVVDTATGTADLRRVEYPVDPVREAVRAAELPDETWERLTDGR